MDRSTLLATAPGSTQTLPASRQTVPLGPKITPIQSSARERARAASRKSALSESFAKEVMANCTSDTFRRRDYTDAIIVTVGEEKKEFTVHEDIICCKSLFFAAACSEKWTKPYARRIDLSGQSVTTFRFYMDWIYRGLDANELKQTEYPFPRYTEAMRHPSLMTGLQMQTATLYDILCRLSVLADVLEDSACKAECMKLLVIATVPGFGYAPDEETIKFVAKHATPGSGLFRWTVDQLVIDSIRTKREKAGMATHLEIIPATMKEEILKKILLSMQAGVKPDVMGLSFSYLD